MIKNISITAKVTLSFVFASFVLIGLSIYTLKEYQRQHELFSTVSYQSIPKIRASSQMQIALLEARRAELHIIISTINENTSDVEAKKIDFNKAKQDYMAGFENYGSADLSELEEQSLNFYQITQVHISMPMIYLYRPCNKVTLIKSNSLEIMRQEFQYLKQVKPHYT